MRTPLLYPALLLFLLCSSLSQLALGQDFGFDILGAQNEDFFQAPTSANVRLSPDGNFVVYTRQTYDGERIHLLDLESGEDKIIDEPAAEEGTVSYLAWIKNDTILFQNSFGDLHTKNVKSPQRTKVFDSQRTLLFSNAIVRANATLPRVLSTLPDDPQHILVSAYDEKGIRRIYRLPLQKWDFDKLPKPLFKKERDFDAWHADLEGNVRLATKWGNRGSTLFQRNGESTSWAEMKDMLKAKGTGLNIDLNKYTVLQKRDFLLGFGYQPNRVYFASNRDTDTTALYLYDLDKGEILERVAYDPTYDLIDIDSGLGHPVISPSKRKWIGIHYDAERPSTIWFEPEYETLQAEIDAALPDSSNLILDFDSDESKFVVNAIWSHRPPEHFLYEKNTHKLTQIGAADHPIARHPGIPSHPISFQGKAGHTIHGYFTPGKTSSNSPAPLVILVHGGPWARDSWTYDPFTQCLAHNGYSTLRINYRSSKGYGYKHFISAAQDYGWAVQEDIADARKWAISEGLAQADNFAIMGFSYGGYAAALAAASQPDAFQCAIPISGIYDIVMESKSLKKQMGRSLTYEMWKQMVGNQWKDREQLAAISPSNLVDSITIPLLVAHGARDPIASVEHARRFTEALETHDKDFEYIELEEEGHSLDLPKNQSYLFEKIDAFLASHLNKSP